MSDKIDQQMLDEMNDDTMVWEKNRLKTFKSWSITDGKCTKEQMSSCGFYRYNGGDSVRCFCCFKELDGWQPSDDPWAEHQRNNDCYFANLAKPEGKLTVGELLSVIQNRQIKIIERYNQQMIELEELEMKSLGLDIEK
ncbi:unnamed protein product [Medioppia subpectinata]|uniref:Uncharacterized protein n=1 Tax=Medioppia subpectinata TaxID=1979941 RepID=A0A7R9QBR5_9ACAR|nr:unnamed protein product [Medioppia subpectinata]CAG2117642.1 unnamed protein product [Medioppia subpectinata]